MQEATAQSTASLTAQGLNGIVHVLTRVSARVITEDDVQMAKPGASAMPLFLGSSLARAISQADSQVRRIAVKEHNPMRIIATVTGLFILSCSSGQVGSQISGSGSGSGGGAGGSASATGAGSPVNLGVGSNPRDCANATDKEGCSCTASNGQRDCQVGTCAGKQSCITTTTKEIISSVWGACNTSGPQSGTCSTADGAGGATGSAGTTSVASAGKGSTEDGSGGKGSSHDGSAGKGSSNDGSGGKGSLPSLCSNDKINNEPEILVAYAPSDGQSVGQTGQIKVWVNDEGAPFISPNEVLDPDTGAITTPGDRTAKAPDGYLWEPALYIAPDTAENGGTPHFPQLIKGWYNYPGRGKGAGFSGAATEPVPGNPKLQEKYTAEDIWDVSALGLAPGNYIAEFVVWDGDTDRAVGCIRIVITP